MTNRNQFTGPGPLAERFWPKVEVGATPDDCATYQGYRDNKGYGHIKVAGVSVAAHRLAWELTHGPIPEGMCVCHHCDNPPCCNDRHLFLGTKADNYADMEAKGRGPGRRKLTDIDVRAIHSRLRIGDPASEIAVAFGVQPITIYRIRAGRTWSRLSPNGEARPPRHKRREEVRA